MQTPSTWNEPLGIGLWQSSWQASVLIGVVLLLQWLFGTKLSPGWRYSLWFLVLARLALPFTPESTVSIFNVAIFDSLRPSNWSVESLDTISTPARLNPLISLRPLTEAPAAAPEVSQTSQASGSTSIVRSPSVWITKIWVLGVLLQVVRIGWQNVRFSKRAKDRVLVTRPDLIELLEECKALMKVRLHISVFETPLVRSPALYGLIRPRLLLPEQLIESFSRQELRHVLLHELAHVKRSDMVVNWLMTVLQTLHWFNPLIWFAFRRMKADRELACDALALARANEPDPSSYGATIIKLIEGFARPVASPSLLGILEEKNQMQRRIRMIAHFRRPSRWSVWAILLFVGLGFVGLTDAHIPKQTFPTPGVNASGVNQATALADAKERPSDIRVTGQVFDKSTSKPIDAFSILVRKKIGSQSGPRATTGFQPAGSGTNGHFHLTFDGLTINYEIEIRADDYLPKRVGWLPFEDGDQDLLCQLVKAVPLEGLVRFPDGKPAAGVEVALRTDVATVVFNHSGLLNRASSVITRTDADGRFAFKPEAEALDIVAVDARGYAEVKVDATLALQELTLQSWGRIEGVLLVGKKAGKDEKVGLERKGPLLAYSAKTDDAGRFVFERVPPGELTVSRLLSHGPVPGGVAVSVGPGETVHAKLGGTGRTVVGRLTWPADGRTIEWKSNNFEALFTSRSTPSSATFPLRPRPDGFFSITDVPPGTYLLNVTVFQESGIVSFTNEQSSVVSSRPASTNVLAASRPPLARSLLSFAEREPVAGLAKTVEVPATSQNDDSLPFDIGALEMQSLSSTLTSKF